MTPAEADTTTAPPAASTGSQSAAAAGAAGPAELPADVWEVKVDIGADGSGWGDVGLFEHTITDVTDDQNASIRYESEEFAPGVTRVTVQGPPKTTMTVRVRSTSLRQ